MSVHRETAEAEIRQRFSALVEGIGGKDLDSLKRLYVSEMVSFDLEAPLQHSGLDAKLRNWETVFAAFADIDYEIRDLTLTVGDEVAFGYCFGRLSGTLKNGVRTSGMWVRGTFCFRRIDGNWLIEHDHVSVPLDMRSGRAVTDLAP